MKWKILLLILLLPYNIYAAVTGESLMNVQDSSISTSFIAPSRVKDAGTAGDNITLGLMGMGSYLFDGANWDRVRGDSTYGLDVDVTRVSGSVTVVGNKTPADNYVNPADHIGAWSLTGIFDGTTWDRWLASTHGDNLTTVAGANVASFLYGFDNSNWDRILTIPPEAAVGVVPARFLASAGFVYVTNPGVTNWHTVQSQFNNADGLAVDGTYGALESLSYNTMFNGTTWDRVRGTIANGLRVDGRLRTISSTFANPATIGNTQLVALSGTTVIKVYNVVINNNAGTANNVKLTTGTGTSCGTGTTDLTGLIVLGTTNPTVTIMSPNMPFVFTPAGNALCINLSVATAVGVTITYAQE